MSYYLGVLFFIEMSECNLEDVFFPLQTITPPTLKVIIFFTAFSTALVVLPTKKTDSKLGNRLCDIHEQERLCGRQN